MYVEHTQEKKTFSGLVQCNMQVKADGSCNHPTFASHKCPKYRPDGLFVCIALLWCILEALSALFARSVILLIIVV